MLHGLGRGVSGYRNIRGADLRIVVLPATERPQAGREAGLEPEQTREPRLADAPAMAEPARRRRVRARYVSLM